MQTKPNTMRFNSLEEVGDMVRFAGTFTDESERLALFDELSDSVHHRDNALRLAKQLDDIKAELATAPTSAAVDLGRIAGSTAERSIQFVTSSAELGARAVMLIVSIDPSDEETASTLANQFFGDSTELHAEATSSEVDERGLVNLEAARRIILNRQITLEDSNGNMHEICIYMLNHDADGHEVFVVKTKDQEIVCNSNTIKHKSFVEFLLIGLANSGQPLYSADVHSLGFQEKPDKGRDQNLNRSRNDSIEILAGLVNTWYRPENLNKKIFQFGKTDSGILESVPVELLDEAEIEAIFKATKPKAPSGRKPKGGKNNNEAAELSQEQEKYLTALQGLPKGRHSVRLILDQLHNGKIDTSGNLSSYAAMLQKIGASNGIDIEIAKEGRANSANSAEGVLSEKILTQTVYWLRIS